MKAVRVHAFGGVEALMLEEVPRPEPGAGQVLVRVAAAGVGPWDAWVRAGQSALPQPLPLTPGADLAGIVERVGADVTGVHPGDVVFGVTNPQFTGAYAEYALADVGMIAPRPMRLTAVEAASVPVVATTAWQMVFDHGRVARGQRVLIHGAAGNVGAYAVRLAKRAGAEVLATVRGGVVAGVLALGADRAIDVGTTRFEDVVQDADVVLDTVGGEMLARSFAVLRRGGALISSVAAPDAAQAARHGVRALFFLVTVTRATLSELAALLEAGDLTTKVGEVLPLAEVRRAHEMLAGAPHRPGKIVLAVADLIGT